ncbi:MAG: hypothetical protein LBU51_01810 [Bacteroidales bacterium]|jgi:hypothetical protein|nr:hypothetical protein [Bacteroidales bacterium]
MKLLTLSSYFENVETNIFTFDLNGLLDYLENKSVKKTNEQLNGNRGISMLNYTINNTTVFFVDHSCKLSRTPIKCYFYDCDKICSLFPCDSGAISISLNTDGYISSCRGRKDLELKVFNESELVIAEKLKSLLTKFDTCVKINVDNIA